MALCSFIVLKRFSVHNFVCSPSKNTLWVFKFYRFKVGFMYDPHTHKCLRVYFSFVNNKLSFKLRLWLVSCRISLTVIVNSYLWTKLVGMFAYTHTHISIWIGLIYFKDYLSFSFQYNIINDFERMRAFVICVGISKHHLHTIIINYFVVNFMNEHPKNKVKKNNNKFWFIKCTNLCNYMAVR